MTSFSIARMHLLIALLGLGRVSPSLRCIRIDGRVFTRRNPTEDILQLTSVSVLHSLRVIEIDCFEDNPVEKAVKLAIDVLRKCAENKPTTKGRDSRRTSIARVGLNSLKSPCLEPRLVRILRYAFSHTYGRTPSDFVPVRIEEFPVKL